MKASVGIAAGVALLGLLAYWRLRKAAAAGAFDPTDRNNLAYSGVNSVGAALTGDEHFSLGVWFYEQFYGDRDAQYLASTPRPYTQ